MQQNNEFSFTLNGPTLNVRKVDHFDGLEGGLYRRIFIAHNGLWYAELMLDHGKKSFEVDPDQDYDAYFRKALDAASILIGATTYECVDLATVAISPQIGKNCVVVAPGGVYAIQVTGNLLPMQMSGAVYQRPQPIYVHGHQSNQLWWDRMAVAAEPLTHRSPGYGQQVIIPGVPYSGIFIENSGFIHWSPTDRGHSSAIPVINPMLSFEDRMMLEYMLRAMIQNQQRTYTGGVTTPTYDYTSDDPEQHRFGTSEDPVGPQ